MLKTKTFLWSAYQFYKHLLHQLLFFLFFKMKKKTAETYLIFYNNVQKMKDFQITSICFPAWETSASMVCAMT